MNGVDLHQQRRSGIVKCKRQWPITDLDQNVRSAAADNLAMKWQPIATAPFDRDLELAVIGYSGVHELVFPCRRILGGWMSAETKSRARVAARI
jgi:hypothetical protein